MIPSPLFDTGGKVGRVREYTVDTVVKDVLFPNYETQLLGSESLRDRCRDERLWELEQGKTLSKVEQSNLVPLTESEGLQYRNKPFFTFTDPFVAEIRNVHLVGYHPTPITPEGKIVGDLIYLGSDDPNESFDWRFYKRVMSALREAPGRTLLSVKTGSSRFDAPSIPFATTLCEPTDNYYHWMIEHLPKIRGVERFEEATGNEVTLILRENPPSFIHEALDVLGYAEDRYVEWSGGPLRVEHLVVPSFPEPDSETLRWMRDSLAGSENRKTVSSKWIYISRQNAENGRRVENYDELSALLSKYDIEPVYNENVTLQEEIANLQYAEGVISPHGAGLTSMSWTNSLSVVELFGSEVNAPFYIFAEILDHEYAALAGRGVGGPKPQRYQDISVDISALEDVLSTRRYS